MNQDLALRVLGQIMGWDDQRAREEFRWLRLMSRVKYDEYRDFVAGVRFLERLTDWLQQFAQEDREDAYQFVRKRLVYFGPAELRRLVEIFYSDHVEQRLVRAIAAERCIPAYRVWADSDAATAVSRLRRRTLFMALSEGARLDIFRRANAGVISNEQVVTTTQPDPDKWRDLTDELCKDLSSEGERFQFICLVDDFTASGITLNRFDDRKGQWKGKLVRFWDSLKPLVDNVCADDWTLWVHHHIATDAASRAVRESEEKAREDRGDEWFPQVEFSFGVVLPQDLPVSNTRDPEFFGLITRYYDSAVEDRHMSVGGSDDLRLGFAECALPVVLEHNTPNNSVALIWAETEGSNGGHAMRPLFRRRQRHS